MCERKEYKIVDTIGVTRVKKPSGKYHHVQLFIFMCPICRNVTKSRSFSKIYKKCKNCWSTNYLNLEFDNGSKVIEVDDEHRKFKILCHCGNTHLMQRINLFRRIKHKEDIVCKECGRIKTDKSHAKTDYPTFVKRVSRLIKVGATVRKLDFNLSLIEIEKLINQDCFYCGNKPILYFNPRQYTTEYKRNGIDRIDSSIGYNINNCVSSCKLCNSMKLDSRQKEFLEQVNKIYKYQNGDIIKNIKGK